MNKVAATITAIQRADAISIVNFDVSGQTMRMMGLELNEQLHVGSEVMVGTKATNIALTRETVEMISISNQLEVTIDSINMGALLCSIHFLLAGQLWESVITRESAVKMQLAPNEKVTILIKSSELSIVETV